jgi:hypothetical protein
VRQAGGTKGLPLHAVQRLLESVECDGWHQDDHLHLAVRIGNVTQGVRLEEGGEISRLSSGFKLGHSPQARKSVRDGNTGR